MNNGFWQAKIWGILHDPVLKGLHTNFGRGENSVWLDLAVMSYWKEKRWNPEGKDIEIDGNKVNSSCPTVLDHIHNADYLTSASDRAAIGSLSESIDYDGNGLEISHLLSGAKQRWQLKPEYHRELVHESTQNRSAKLIEKERSLLPSSIKESKDEKKVFWWLWRCLPEVICHHFQDQSLMLMPAETRIPDGSIWSHLSLTGAMAGALAGYDLTTSDIEKWQHGKQLSRPAIATFSFSPIQELIKASRKMRDFWAGSWLLHYLSARVCWELAWHYGPDSLVYPSLYAQPLIDYWLLNGLNGFNGYSLEPEFNQWLENPTPGKILTAGFPNVIVVLLPQERVKAAMQLAKQTLLEEWQKIGDLSFDEIRKIAKNWMPGLEKESDTWNTWLKSQWQTYWVGYPLGDPKQDLRSGELYQSGAEKDDWTKAQNQYCQIVKEQEMFLEQEREFLIKAGELRKETTGRYPFKANVGSWWAYLFDRVRHSLTAVKNARSWDMPVAFGVRSTVSGIGSALHSKRWHEEEDTESSIKEQWQKRVGLFDGREMLNATETVKRVIHRVLPKLLSAVFSESENITIYPDLTAGVAGYLKTSKEARDHYSLVCQRILDEFPETRVVAAEMEEKWGIPYADEHLRLQRYHPRLLNASWLIEDIDVEEEKRRKLQSDLDEFLSQKENYPGNNPSDWYVLATGDGDSMSEWLQGKRLKNYGHYIPEGLLEKVRNINPNTREEYQELKLETANSFQQFLKVKKRMGASTHSAFSRALLDFSNQLLPYITEQRYAGRLIYGGGDDVLAYTNLWEWDNWLWDVRQCFRGAEDPHEEFKNDGDYWRWQGEKNDNVSDRPLFTMGQDATISFGIVIAHHSVPLAIALESMWQAEEEAKEHEYFDEDKKKGKDAVQVRVIYGNGNVLKATSKFDTFHQWQGLLKIPDLEPALFEQAAQIWEQHPVPVFEAIDCWCSAFCDRREKLKDNNKDDFRDLLAQFIKALWITTQEDKRDKEVQNWLKLGAFILRKREIKINSQESQTWN